MRCEDSWGWGFDAEDKPLNSSTLEYLLVDQVKFRLNLFGGVVVVFIIYQPSSILIYIPCQGSVLTGSWVC